MVAVDLAVQAVHVTNQSLIYAARPAARSRLAGAYMVFYSVGIGGGALASTATYAAAGWTAVCALGATLSLAALAVWRLAEGPAGAGPSSAAQVPWRHDHPR